MGTEAVRLRLLDAILAGRRQWVFIALTDAELREFKTGQQTSLAPFKGRIISVCPDAAPTGDQRRTALRAFGLRFERGVTQTQ